MKIETIFNLPEGFSVNKFTLTFKSKEFENNFMADFFESSKISQRVSIFLSLLLFSLFGLMDLILFSGKDLQTILMFRFLLGVPSMLAFFVISFSSIYKKYWQEILGFAIFMVGLSTVFIIIAMPHPQRDFNFPGLMLILFYGFVVMKLRFIYSIFVSFSLTILYVIFAITLTDVKMENLINNTSFFLATNVMGIYASYLIELYERKEYFLRVATQLEKEHVKQLLAKEQSVNFMKTRFMNVTSHVFRNPLTAIISSSQVLKSMFERDKNELGTKFNLYINHSANELINLLNRVQFMTKYDSGEISTFHNVFDFYQILEKVEKKLESKEEKKFKIEKNISEFGRLISTDVNLFEILLLELLSNAVKFSPNESVIYIELDKKQSGESILKISDKGVGFDESIFQNTSTTFNYENDISIAGLGLGFTIIKICINLLKAELNYTKNDDSGMTAEVIFNLQQ